MRTQIFPSPQHQIIYKTQPQINYQHNYVQLSYRKPTPAFVVYKQQPQQQSYMHIRQQQPIYQPQPIISASPVRQYRNSIHHTQLIQNTITPPQQFSNSRHIYPNSSQQQHTISQHFPRYSISKQSYASPNIQFNNQPQQQIFPQQNYQQPQHTPQIKSISPVATQQEDDLEKRFQEAIDRTRDLVQKYNPQDQTQPQQPQQLALQYEDGFIYRGQGFEPAIREGFGVLTDQYENEVYSGYWSDNQYHGQGKLINFQVEQIQGPYDYRDLGNIENGWLSYQGDFYEGKMHGKGLLVLTNGEQFEGHFSDGMIDGQGVYTTADKQDIRGVWKDGILVE